jgi:hypothetical protein
MAARRIEPRARGDRGAGVFGTTFGLMMFLGFLFFAVQLLFNLYATSVVTSAAHDAARQVATLGHPPTSSDLDAAEARARDLLGGYGWPDRVTFDWHGSDVDVVRLHVRANNPRFLPSALDQALAFDTIDRTVEVRVERLR